MNKAKEILYKHAKSNGCKSDLLRNPFLEQAVLNAINEALTIPAVGGRSEELLALAQYMCEHQNNLDGKTAKDYLQDFLSQSSTQVPKQALRKTDVSCQREQLKAFLSTMIEEFDNGEVSWETRDSAESLLKSL